MGLDDLVALGVTVVITQDAVILQVARDNAAGESAAKTYVMRNDTHPDEGDGWIRAEIVTVSGPGGLNVARNWGLFTDYLRGSSFVTIYRDLIVLNYYGDDRTQADILYEKLHVIGVKIEKYENESFNFMTLGAAIERIPLNKPVSFMKRLDGQFEVSTVKVIPARDGD